MCKRALDEEVVRFALGVGGEGGRSRAGKSKLSTLLLAECRRYNRWIYDLRLYVLFNCISVISGRWAYDNERQCAREPRLR